MTSVNFDKKLIYLHIPKTAGTYIQLTLLKKYGFFVYNWCAPDYQSCVFSYKNLPISTYFSQPEILEIMGIENLDEYRKFTFVRNPYHRFISAWKYLIEKGYLSNTETLENIIINRESYSGIIYNHLFVSQCEHMKEWSFDEIGKFETLEEDLQCILKEFDINKTHVNEKHNVTKEYGDPMKFYTRNILEFVNEHFREDFIRFGYDIFEIN
jgi:hypothetical protein